MPLLPTCYSPAKINLFLYVLAKRSDNYHELYSAMLPLKLSDALDIEASISDLPLIQLSLNKEESTVSTDFMPVDHSNLICKAYNAFYKKSPQLEPFALKIILTKHIPLQAGLGGGSSNAASILNTLNHLHNDIFTSSELINIATTLGADVPFFIGAKPALATGIGEKLAPLELDFKLGSILLIKPLDVSQPTGELFTALSRSQHYTAQPDIKMPLQQEITPENITSHLHNDFEHPLRQRQPKIDQLFKHLESNGFTPCLSGTGPTIFVFLPPTLNPQQQACLETLQQDPTLWVVQTKLDY